MTVPGDSGAGSRRRRLRFRVMAAFAVGGLVVSASLSALSYVLSRTYLLDQRQSSAVHEAEANAALVDAVLRSPPVDLRRLVSSLQRSSGAESVVLYGGRWYGTSAVGGPDALPSALRAEVVDQRRAARQIYPQGSQPVLTIGFPVSGVDAYFQITNLNDLVRTLRILRDTLAAGSLVAFLLSLAIGAWATRRVLRPLRDIGQAAAAISSGELAARLDPSGDEELVELATGFNTMVDSLQARIERDARFASDVSHELRSPLTTLRSAVEVMARRGDSLDGRGRRALELLSDEVNRFEQLVEDLLEISRYDAGVARLELEAVDVAALFKGLLAEADQEVPVVTDGDTTTILADRRRLEQALRNLIRNAVVHAGGVTAARVEVGEHGTVLVVEDRGPGIAPADRTTVFERFARGAAAGRRSSGVGVGLGLALVAEHVGLQGGSVGVEEARPHGCRFVIRLPTRRP